MQLGDSAPGDRASYRHEVGWERMREVAEAVPVQGAPDREVRLKFTRHGPVINPLIPTDHRGRFGEDLED